MLNHEIYNRLKKVAIEIKADRNFDEVEVIGPNTSFRLKITIPTLLVSSYKLLNKPKSAKFKKLEDIEVDVRFNSYSKSTICWVKASRCGFYFEWKQEFTIAEMIYWIEKLENRLSHYDTNPKYFSQTQNKLLSK